MHDPYRDIRPYQDIEVTEVLERLGRSELLHRALVRYRFPSYPSWLQGAMARLIGFQLRRHFAPLTTVAAFQGWLLHWIEDLLSETTTDIKIVGLDKLDPAEAYLWMSNHRDIAMDPTLINLALSREQWPTAHIAIGDNLLQNPVLADVMRLNKSFIVKRSAQDRRSKLEELKRLSAYIRDSVATGHSVWLAQREGRAKDNRDYTDTAVLKMLALSAREEGLEFSVGLGRLKPIPVIVQYEWDPCDVLKARELVAYEAYGRYEKSDGEDTRSLLLGLTGHKGQVHIGFGQPLREEQMTDAASVALAIDEQIQNMSVIFPVSYAALYLLQHEFNEEKEVVWDNQKPSDELLSQLRRRFQGEEATVSIRLLKTYAAPLIPVTER